MKSWQSLVVGLMVGGALGFALSALRTMEVEAGLTAAESPSGATKRSDDARGSEVRLVDGRAPAPAAPPDELREAVEDEELISERLREYALEGIARGWSAVRADSIPAATLERGWEGFAEAVLALPEQIGRKLGEEQTKREEALEDARTGGVFALLEKLDAGGAGPVVDLVRDRGEFESLFQRDASETFIGGTTIGRADLEGIVAGSTLTFPAGVFALTDLLRYWDDVPRDITIAGAGMDATLIVVNDISFDGKLRNFALERCSLFTPRGYLFRHRSDAALVSMEDVRLIGFDSGAGSSCAFGTRALAVHVVRSQILGGYGRSPSSGKLFRVDTPALIARFDDCTIERVRVGNFAEGATAVFSNCTLRDILNHEDPSEGNAGLVFDHCAVSLYPSGASKPPKLDLNDLFPDWEQRMVK